MALLLARTPAYLLSVQSTFIQLTVILRTAQRQTFCMVATYICSSSAQHDYYYNIGRSECRTSWRTTADRQACGLSRRVQEATAAEGTRRDPWHVRYRRGSNFPLTAPQTNILLNHKRERTCMHAQTIYTVHTWVHTLQMLKAHHLASSSLSRAEGNNTNACYKRDKQSRYLFYKVTSPR